MATDEDIKRLEDQIKSMKKAIDILNTRLRQSEQYIRTLNANERRIANDVKAVANNVQNLATKLTR